MIKDFTYFRLALLFNCNFYLQNFLPVTELPNNRQHAQGTRFDQADEAVC